jgi:hypothetical protein
MAVEKWGGGLKILSYDRVPEYLAKIKDAFLLTKHQQMTVGRALWPPRLAGPETRPALRYFLDVFLAFQGGAQHKQIILF